MTAQIREMTVLVRSVSATVREAVRSQDAIHSWALELLRKADRDDPDTDALLEALGLLAETETETIRARIERELRED